MRVRHFLLLVSNLKFLDFGGWRGFWAPQGFFFFILLARAVNRHHNPR